MGDNFSFSCSPSPSSPSLPQLHQEPCGLKSLLAASLVRDKGCWGGRSPGGGDEGGTSPANCAELLSPCGEAARKEGGREEGKEERKGRREGKEEG